LLVNEAIAAISGCTVLSGQPKNKIRSGFKTSDQLRDQCAGFRKNAAYQAYVSILRKTATQISELRCGFEMASNDYRLDKAVTGC
jgi:hypothetical protein